MPKKEVKRTVGPGHVPATINTNTLVLTLIVCDPFNVEDKLRYPIAQFFFSFVMDHTQFVFVDLFLSFFAQFFLVLGSQNFTDHEVAGSNPGNFHILNVD